MSLQCENLRNTLHSIWNRSAILKSPRGWLLIKPSTSHHCRQGVEESGAAATAHGTLPQAHFLAGLGIQTRLEELLKTASEEEQSSLVSGYIRLLDYRNPDGTSPFDETEQTSERTSNAGSAQPESLPADSTTEAEERDQLEDEGMGMAYKVLAIVPKRYAAPIPFPGWQEQ